VPYLCRGGVCGFCQTRVLEVDGELLHHDHFLSDADKAKCNTIMPCVSRARGKQGDLYSRRVYERGIQTRRDLPRRLHLPQQPAGDPALSAAVSGRRVHVLGQHRAASAGPPGSVTEFAIDIDEHYVAECRERAIVLAAEPLRFQALPHMLSAQWDCLELIMESLARDYPAHFSLAKQGNRWHWINRPLQIDQHFTFGDVATLPQPPLEYITRQTPRAIGSSWISATAICGPRPAW
jgi:hypothetical protein